MDQQPSVAYNVATATGCVINEDWVGPTAVISVAGIIDMMTSPQLEAAITAALAKTPAALIIDLTNSEEAQPQDKAPKATK